MRAIERGRAPSGQSSNQKRDIQLRYEDDWLRDLLPVLRAHGGFIGVAPTESPSFIRSIYAFNGDHFEKLAGARERDDFFAVRIVHPLFYVELANALMNEEGKYEVYALFGDGFKAQLDSSVERQLGDVVNSQRVRVTVAFDRSRQEGFRIEGIHPVE
jgi:hypothetical protein